MRALPVSIAFLIGATVLTFFLSAVVVFFLASLVSEEPAAQPDQGPSPIEETTRAKPSEKTTRQPSEETTRPTQNEETTGLSTTSADIYDCDGLRQGRAQRILDRDPSDPHNLDPDRNGVACDS